MHNPTEFQETRLPVLQALMREHPFATLVHGGPAGLDANHLPLLLDAGVDGGPGRLRGHVARRNPMWRAALAEGVDCLVLFQGPSAYVSPSWYASKAQTHKVVPTWNYVVVHARGRLRAIEDPAWLRRTVGDLTERFEHGRDAPWRLADAPEDYVQAMLRAIVGIQIELESIVGQWKLSQNKSEADRQGVLQGLRQEADGGAQAVAAAMT